MLRHLIGWPIVALGVFTLVALAGPQIQDGNLVLAFFMAMPGALIGIFGYLITLPRDALNEIADHIKR